MNNNQNPAEFIRERRKELEDKIRRAVHEFQQEVDLAVRDVQVYFIDTSTVAGRFQTDVGYVRVILEDL